MKDKDREAELDKIWKEYEKTKDPTLKDELIVAYAPLVKYVASRLSLMVGQYVDYDDLVGYGVFGLIDAVNKFDYDKGYKFETYATLRIRGSIIDNIRKLDWVPRSIRSISKDVEKAYSQLESSLGREPTDKEIADFLQVSEDEAREMIKKSSVASLISLDEFSEQNNGHVNIKDESKSAYVPEIELDSKETKKILVEALETLTEKEKIVVNLYYFDELTLKEISNVLDVSESRVSQIHSKAILKLNTKLGEHKNILFNN